MKVQTQKHSKILIFLYNTAFVIAFMRLRTIAAHRCTQCDPRGAFFIPTKFQRKFL